MTNEDRSADLTRVLAEACSIQAKIENRTWLGIIAVTVVLMLPASASSGGMASTSEIPVIGQVPSAVLGPLAFALLAILIVALAAAHAQHIRADQMCHGVLKDLPGVSARGPTARELFDMLRVPSFTRVAPLPQWLRGKWQWQAESSPCPLWRRIAATFLYVLLQLVALIVLFATPGIAIWLSYDRATAGLGQPWVAIFWSMRAIAIAALVVVTLAHALTIWPRLRRFAAAHWEPAT